MGSTLFDFISSQFREFSIALFTAFQAFQTTAALLATLIFMLIGIGYVKGNWHENSQRMLYVMISLPFTVWAVFGSGSFFITDMLIPLFSDFPFALTVFFMTIPAESGALGMQGIDNAYVALFDSIQKYGVAVENLGMWTSVKSYAAIGLLLSAFGAVYAIFYGTQVLSMGSIYLFMGISPVFIYLFAFPQTKGWAMSWLREMIKYSMMGPLAGAVMALTIKATSGAVYRMRDHITNNPGESVEVFNGYFGAALFMSVITIMMLRAVPDFAASLTGGTQSDTGAYAVGRNIRQLTKSLDKK